ncbi:MAG: YgiQ family radical SAM protein [Methylococcaceae bacterium]
MSQTLLTPPNLFSYRQYWAHRFGVAPQLPMNRAEMDELGWDSCDIIVVSGDAYVDHPSFGMALIGRMLEAQGFRVGMIAQPDWKNVKDFQQLGRPNLFFGITSGNMDSMVNHYTSDKKIRSNDAYTPNGEASKRPDRATSVYSHRCREAFKDVPIIIGGIEASLRRIAHYDYWSDTVKKSVLLDSKADLLLFGNAERAIVEVAHRLAKGEKIQDIKFMRGTAHFVKEIPAGFAVKDSTDFDKPGATAPPINPYQEEPPCDKSETVNVGATSVALDNVDNSATEVAPTIPLIKTLREKTAIRLPDYEVVKNDPIFYAHASRVMHGETNPYNARPLIQKHGDREVWINPPPLPLSTPEMDGVFDLPYSRLPHKIYGGANIPAFEMIQHSVNIMRGCFGGCSFCSITEHEGRIIQSRSEDSIIQEIEAIRDTSPTFTGYISDLGGPTANMYRLACKDKAIESACRKLSCVHPGICPNLNTDHSSLIKLYRRARGLKGVKKIFIASGLRYDLAVESPEYVKELVTHHVGGYLKIAPEHTEQNVLTRMMKPGMGTYDRFKEMFDRFSKEAGKEQYLIPYFIAAHPGTTDEDMLQLALWLKRNNFRADQVQAFLPSPMSIATAMYHSGKDTLKKVSRTAADITIPKSVKQRRIQKAFLRYHDPKNWPLLREALKSMGRADLIGNGKMHLIPTFQPAGTFEINAKTQPFKTKYTTGFGKTEQRSDARSPKTRRTR